jgi:hypothetical protein
VRSYLNARGHGKEAEKEALQWVCSAMAWILEELLPGTGKWDPYNWVDAISPGEAYIFSPGELNVEGLVIWCKGSDGEWWEPFSGVVGISESGDQLLGYALKFGDAAWGVGNVGYGSHPRGWNWSRPEKWVFEFAKGAYVTGTVDHR